jgi:hypothetical protein
MKSSLTSMKPRKGAAALQMREIRTGTQFDAALVATFLAGPIR